MVRRLHDAGIEVILDVVYNHTCEGNDLGPTFASRARQRHLLPAAARPEALLHRRYRRRQHAQLAHPRVLQMVLDSLRYWVTEMHVDGFRFDLARILGRGPDGFDPGIRLLRRDPPGPGAVASQAIIASPGISAPGLSARQSSRRASRMERPLSRRRAPVLARRRRHAAGARGAPRPARPISSTAPAAGPGPRVNFVDRP